MFEDLQKNLVEKTWHEVVFFQLRSINLPDAFESEIQNTEVKGQDIKTAQAEFNRDSVGFETKEIVAFLAMNATIEKAYGTANETKYNAEAEAFTITEVI